MNDPTLTYLAEQLRPAAEPATQTITLWAHRYPIERVMVEGGAKPYLYADKQADDDVPFSFVVGRVAEADPLQGMSEINRAVAYSAAAKLRQLGYEWTGGEWAAPTAAPEPGAWRMIDKHGDSVHAPRALAAAPEPVAWEGGEGWESLAWELCADENGEDACNELIWEGGPIPEPWGDRWMKYEGEAKRLIALVHKHAAHPPREASVAPEPAPVAYKVWHREAKHCFCLASELPTEFRSDTGEPDEYFGGKVQPLFAHPPREASVAPEPPMPTKMQIPPPPIDLVLHCPACGLQHLDAPENERTEQVYEGPDVVDEVIVGWENPPHRSHLCLGCGHIWRPADVATNGVQAVKTKGTNDDPLPDRSKVRAGTHNLFDREDGLAHCKVCGGAEASMPTECPGRQMTGAESDAVQGGTADFRNGTWYDIAKAAPTAAPKPLPEYRILHLLDLAMARLSGPPRSAGDVVVAVVRAIEALPTQE